MPVKAGTTLVAGYFAPNGRYSSDSDYFAAGPIARGPLVAPQSVAGAGNGLYRYGSSLVFPDSSWRASNYWVDVVFGP